MMTPTRSAAVAAVRSDLPDIPNWTRQVALTDDGAEPTETWIHDTQRSRGDVRDSVAIRREPKSEDAEYGVYYTVGTRISGSSYHVVDAESRGDAIEAAREWMRDHPEPDLEEVADR